MRLTILVTLLALTVSACSLPGRFMRGYAEADAQGMELLEEGGAFAHAPSELRGQVRFMFDDFGSLTTDELERYGVPWKLVVAAVVRDRHLRTGAPLSQRTFMRALTEYGFLTPRRVANWSGDQPRLDHPMGMTVGSARRGFPAVEIELASLGCASCHSGALYGPDGRPTGDAWVGLPNTSLDLDAFADDAFAALTSELAHPDTLLSTIGVIFPQVSDRELSTIRKHIIPRVREELAERAGAYGGLVPFRNGGPGLMNGVASLRFLIGALDSEAPDHQVTWASPPDLTGSTLRRSLLVDGVFAPPQSVRFGSMALSDVTDEHLRELAGVTSITIVTTAGIRPEDGRKAIPEMEDVVRFMHTLESPPFPGIVDTALVRSGERIYGEACASCHGRYSSDLRNARLLEHPNRLVAHDRMMTDPVRWETADSASLAKMADLDYVEHIEALRTGGYVAPDLAGIWATAPYLHNGSIPTLWHLLHAGERPERFYVGGHELDYELLGIAGELGEDGIYRYRGGYEPWSRPFLYDTRERGRSSAGHEFPGLTESQKRAILEYMKVL